VADESNSVTRQRGLRVVREDLSDLDHGREPSLVEQLTDFLPSKVGSPLSDRGLREDWQIDHKTAGAGCRLSKTLTPVSGCRCTGRRRSRP
jgi:hypothetical protein